MAARHIHMHTDDAESVGLHDGDHVRIQCSGPRGIIMDNVLVRVKPTYKLEMHVDTDEANAALLKNGDKCRILH